MRPLLLGGWFWVHMRATVCLEPALISEIKKVDAQECLCSVYTEPVWPIEFCTLLWQEPTWIPCTRGRICSEARISGAAAAAVGLRPILAALNNLFGPVSRYTRNGIWVFDKGYTHGQSYCNLQANLNTEFDL